MEQGIDPVTGLPLLDPTGVIEQIPLGNQVFPYNDLNATARPTRGPLYGDDIIPTSALGVGHDVNGVPRAQRATTSRDLYIREAVFQNLGQKIPDGTTAPVDVNVVSGGGGGGAGAVAMKNYWASPSIVDGNYDQVSPNITIVTLYGVAYYCALNAGATAFTNVAYETQLYFGSTGNPATANPFFVPPGITYIGASENPPGRPYWVCQWFPPVPINMAAYTVNGASQIWFRSQNYPATVDIHIYYV